MTYRKRILVAALLLALTVGFGVWAASADGVVVWLIVTVYLAAAGACWVIVSDLWEERRKRRVRAKPER